MNVHDDDQKKIQALYDEVTSTKGVNHGYSVKTAALGMSVVKLVEAAKQDPTEHKLATAVELVQHFVDVALTGICALCEVEPSEVHMDAIRVLDGARAIAYERVDEGRPVLTIVSKGSESIN